jgi:hypothetical protein
MSCDWRNKDIVNCVRWLLFYLCQSSCLQIKISECVSLRYQIFWEVVGLERGPLSLVSTTEELLDRKISGSGLEIREYGRRRSVALTTWHLSSRIKLALTFADSRRSFGRYSSLADSDHWVCLYAFVDFVSNVWDQNTSASKFILETPWTLTKCHVIAVVKEFNKWRTLGCGESPMTTAADHKTVAVAL